MNWQETPKKFLCRIVLERLPTGEGIAMEDCEEILRREATDWLYYLLSVFTYLNLILFAIIFFGNLADVWKKTFLLLDALQEPYWGTLGVYVILKEVRKRRRSYPSRYWGELFVVFWLLLLIAATLSIFFSSGYHFDRAYERILTNGLLVLVIYLGAFINKP